MLLLALTPGLPAAAATFPDLYTVSVPPDPAARDIRADATRRAMSVLLTRITGRRDPGANPEMQDLILAADRYLASYETAAGRIRVGFSRTAVNDALTVLNLPLWGAERPSTLLWLAFDMDGGEFVELMADEPGAAPRAGGIAGAPSFPLSPPARARFDALVAGFLTAADERGLPVVLPRLDAEDRLSARFADVWGGFDPFVARAASRYGVDAVLIGRVTADEFGLEARWTLLRGESRQTRVTPDLPSGIHWLADDYAAQYVTVGGVRLTSIAVRGIRSFFDFGSVDDYLKSVSIIDANSVQFLSLSEDGEALFRFAARGDQQNLRQTLALDGRLIEVTEPLSGPGVDGAGTAELIFMPAWLAEAEAARAP